MVKETGEREKKIYTITPEGKKLLEKLSSEFIDTFNGIYLKYQCPTCEHFLNDKFRGAISITLNGGH